MRSWFWRTRDISWQALWIQIQGSLDLDKLPTFSDREQSTCLAGRAVPHPGRLLELNDSHKKPGTGGSLVGWGEPVMILRGMVLKIIVLVTG